VHRECTGHFGVLLCGPRHKLSVPANEGMEVELASYSAFFGCSIHVVFFFGISLLRFKHNTQEFLAEMWNITAVHASCF